MGLTLKEYYDQLEKHDWYWMYSDDSNFYRAGLLETDKLLKIANEQGSDYQKLFEEFNSYIFSGEAFATKQKPKPVRPE